VCVSLEMQALTLDWPPTTRQAQAALWAKAATRGLELRADPEFAGRVHLVRYEEMKADPAEQTQRLFEFAGLDVGDALLAEIVDRSDFRHNRATGAGRHTRKGEVGDWAAHFTEDDEQIFRDVAGDAFEAAGYSF